MTEPFRVFSGWDRRQAEAAEVFAFSVREHASVPVEVKFAGVGVLPNFVSGSHAFEELAGFNRAGVTGFSYSRFLVPWLCDYEDRAVFADGCDMLCLGDVAELADFDLRGKALAVVKHPSLPHQHGLRARSWTSLMLMDCAHPKLKKWTPGYVEKAPDSTLMRLADFHDDEVGDLPNEWNTLCEMAGKLLDENGRVMTASDNVQGRTGLYYAPYEPPAGTRLAHWSYLSDPNGGSWIDRSGSALWAEARERWRENNG